MVAPHRCSQVDPSRRSPSETKYSRRDVPLRGRPGSAGLPKTRRLSSNSGTRSGGLNDCSRHDVGKGTGLGLSTPLGIVKSNGGFVSVDSEIGGGTPFKIFRPARISEEALPKPEALFDSLRGDGEVILVVDDEPSVLNLTKVVLEKNNYRAVTANAAPEALALFAAQMDSITLLLTDLLMPHMDGISLIRAARQMKPGLKVIASTGQGERLRGMELQSLGAHALTKPFDTDQLLRAVSDALRTKTQESG